MAGLTLEQLVALASDRLRGLSRPARMKRLESIIAQKLERATTEREKRFWQTSLLRLDGRRRPTR